MLKSVKKKVSTQPERFADAFKWIEIQLLCRTEIPDRFPGLTMLGMPTILVGVYFRTPAPEKVGLF